MDYSALWLHKLCISIRRVVCLTSMDQAAYSLAIRTHTLHGAVVAVRLPKLGVRHGDFVAKRLLAGHLQTKPHTSELIKGYP